MDENFPPPAGRRVAFAWQFPPSAWDNTTPMRDELGFTERRSPFPSSTWSPRRRAEVDDELTYNVAHNLDPDFSPSYSPPVPAPRPSTISPLGALGAADQSSSYPSWVAEPFSWPDRNSTHQASQYEHVPSTRPAPRDEGFFARPDRNFTQNARVPSARQTSRNERFLGALGDASIELWRPDNDRPRSPNWNLEPDSWAGSNSTDRAEELEVQEIETGPMAFLNPFAKGKATLTFQNDKSELESFHDLNLDVIRTRSPILAMAFEDSRSGPQLYLETLTSTTALPFLRFLYTLDYVPVGDDVPTSVLFHFQMYRLGDIYDLEELKSKARLNVFRQCEYGCCSPDKPIDLCAAVRYFYDHIAMRDGIIISKYDDLINTVIDYCVTCFSRHRLGEDAEFKELAYELRPFHQALCSNIRERNFDPNEVAAAIIQLPFKNYAPETYASREDASAQRFDDVVFHFHAHDELDNASKKRKRVERKVELALRPHMKPLEKDPDFDKVISKRRASSTGDSAKPSPVEVAAAGPETILPLRLSQPSTDDAAEAEANKARRERMESFLSAAIAAAKAKDAAEVEENSDGYEAVSPPPKVEALSDSDSEGSFVQIKHEVNAESSRSVLRVVNVDEANRAAIDEEESDWEWM